ncbi:uncharacterized protein LOC122880375 isoform X2 [Siniperca chuatsi]|uniref:uncharacterized protein LOC122880375 isoform X2 n=1 Tax=Siniperca chuatsi TaxID=119488 RepID=UPI001CE11A3D|nr:uncharacterized protein LOC122880375 isoform X2 [Siniperca chuatsi]
MVMREISLYLLLGHLQAADSVPVQCLRCENLQVIDVCALCPGMSIYDIPPNCTKDFQVSVNNTKSMVQEGDDILLTCVHNLPNLNLTFGWKEGKNIKNGQNENVCALCPGMSIYDIPPNCTKDFQVSVNNTKSMVQEGDDILLTCVHNLPNLNLTFGWKEGKNIKNGQNENVCALCPGMSIYDIPPNCTKAADSVPVQCLRCENLQVIDVCALCPGMSIYDIPPNCTKDFQVSVNSTKSMVQEGDDIVLTCVHNLPNLNLTFGWKEGKNIKNGQNESTLALKKVLTKSQYSCFVCSPFGYYESLPHDVSVNSNSVLLLVICGVSALVLVMSMGLAIKFKLKRDNAKHKKRMKQRAQAGQSGGPAPLTPRES